MNLTQDQSLSPPKTSRSAWNLNNITAHNFSKISLLKAYLAVHKTDIVCLFETYIDFTFPVNYKNVVIQGYNLVSFDHPGNSKRGKGYIYYKSRFRLKMFDIYFMQECLNFHLVIGEELCHFISLDRSPNQFHDEFNSFIKKTRIKIR